MNLVIVGQGAIGLLWHKHFQQLNDPTLLLKVFRSKSLIDDPSDTYNYTNIHGYSQQNHLFTAAITDISNADILLICVKSYQVKAVLTQFSKHIHKKTLIILAHNGMGTLLDISESLLKKHIFLALLTTHGCTRPNTKHIIHTGIGTSDLGLLKGKLSHAQAKSLTSLFNKALPQTYWCNNIIEKQWEKLAINCVINPLTALHNITNGEINSIEFKKLTQLLLTEVIKVAKTEQQNLSLNTLLMKVEQVAFATAKNCSSMRTDVLTKRLTEIDYINGYVHRLGVKHGIATPENTKLWHKIKSLNI